MNRFGVLTGRPSHWRLLVVLVLCWTVAACAGGKASSDTITVPGSVTHLKVSATSVGDDWLSLSWTNPTGANFTGVIVRRLEGDTAPTLTSGKLVTDFTDRADYIVDTGLTPGTQYSYALIAHYGANQYAAAATVTGRTQTAPTP